MSDSLPSEPVAAPQTDVQKLAECRRAGHWVEHVACWQCGGEGFTDHDCGEDCCCCLNPEPNVRCDICHGKGGYPVCITCNPEAYNDAY